jgi:hypothetical protein
MLEKPQASGTRAHPNQNHPTLDKPRGIGHPEDQNRLFCKGPATLENMWDKVTARLKEAE